MNDDVHLWKEGCMRFRLSYANVMSTLAVVIALGGTSYAAVAITGRPKYIASAGVRPKPSLRIGAT